MVALIGNFESIDVLICDTEVELGGRGINVQIYECHFYKRIYNRGHRVDGVCLIRGVEEKREKGYLFVKYQIAIQNPFQMNQQVC